MDFSIFDTGKIDEYARQAKAQWGKTAEYKEFERKAAGRSREEEQTVAKEFIQIFAEFGGLKDTVPTSAAAQEQVKKLQDFITEHYYKCSDDILYSLGQMYAGGGEYTENIDRTGGAGTAKFVAEAIRIYCGR